MTAITIPPYNGGCRFCGTGDEYDLIVENGTPDQPWHIDCKIEAEEDAK